VGGVHMTAPHLGPEKLAAECRDLLEAVTEQRDVARRHALALRIDLDTARTEAAQLRAELERWKNATYSATPADLSGSVADGVTELVEAQTEAAQLREQVEALTVAHGETVRLLERGIGHVDDLERAAGTSEVNREYRLSLERKVVELAEQVEALGRERDSIDAHYQATLRSQARVATRLRDLIAFEHAVLHYRDAIDANTYDGRNMSLEPMAVQVERIEMLNRLRAAEDDVIRIARARRENPVAPAPADESEGA
jgi:hypothetical protein